MIAVIFTICDKWLAVFVRYWKKIKFSHVHLTDHIGNSRSAKV